MLKPVVKPLIFQPSPIPAIRHAGLYRASLSCQIARDGIEGKTKPPANVTPMEWAMFNLLHAVEDIALALEQHVTEPKYPKGVGGPK